EESELFLEKFKSLPSISIDFAISEKSDKVVVFEGDFGWSDIGSFDGLAEILSGKDENSRHIGIDSKNIFIHSTNNRLITTIGVEDLIVVENNDSILIQKRGRSEDVKKIVRHLKDNKFREIDHNLIVYRPWGKYEVLIDSPAHKVKKITVYPGAKLSLQAHYHRAEHWVVVRGSAKIINGENELSLRENESSYIPAMTKHRLENPGKVDLEIIEVQTGNYLEEDDIIRYDDEYKRM
ncbi:MAG: cupin domain-containing protein, partial [Patescibacteria group bacterium]